MKELFSGHLVRFVNLCVFAKCVNYVRYASYVACEIMGEFARSGFVSYVFAS